MSPLAKAQRHMRRLTLALAFASVAALAFLAGQLVGPKPATPDDLLPGRIRACEGEVVTRITNVNLIAVAAYTPAELDAMRTLSEPCFADNIYPELDRTQLDLLARSPVNP